MSVRIQLDQQDGASYTNLDFVTGRVILSLAADTAITAINVKLEGESRTRLAGPKYQNDPKNRQKIDLEVHKLLYKVQTVFPDPGTNPDTGGAQYTLPAGQYSYWFSLKIPFNNDCINNHRIFQEMSLGSLLGQDITSAKHVKQTLPPTLGGFPGQAEVKYFLKATVVRPKFYQENMRSVVDIKFQPVEDPRPAPRFEETYARRQHQFSTSIPITPKSSKSSLFKRPAPVLVDEPPPAIKVEVRLPSPSIISCHQPLPLRILVDKTNDSSATLYLSTLQIELIGYTKIRAHDFHRTEAGGWIIMSQANMNLPLDDPSDMSARSFQVPTRFWDNLPLPNTIAPSFNTCNISRNYELEVRIGVTQGTAGGIQPELIVSSLKVPVQVYTGIRPPQQYRKNTTTTSRPSGTTITPPRFESIPNLQSPMTPIHDPAQDQYPAQSGSYMSPPPDDPDDLPPSYEDAMAEDIVPVDGPRHDPAFSEALNGQRQPSFSDVKSSNTSGLNRHGSERLFSQNAPRAPRAPNSGSGLGSQQYVSPTVEDLSEHMAGMDVHDFDVPARPIPPPLPARKATKDTVSNRNGLT